MGLDFIGKKDSIERNDFKRVKISKLSYGVLILCIILVIVALL